MANIGGYMGKVLRVDLSNGRLSDEVLDESLLRQWIGGTGIGVKILYEEVPAGTEWNSPENRLIFATGPLGGTRTPGSGTYSVITKGPMVQGMVCTQANGFIGARMKFAGYDAVILQGIAPKWSYLYIHDGVAELRDATHLLGKDTWETEDALVKEVGQKQASVACVGPAGESLVRFAAICGDKGHVASSGGAGAVMGSKRLKAIVVYGKQEVPLKNKSKVGSMAKPWFESNSNSALGGAVGALGTLAFYSAAATTGWLPVKNMTTTDFPEHPQFDGSTVRSGKYYMKPRPCWACRLAHCHDMPIPEGEHKDMHVEEPEYEGMAAFSALIGSTDPVKAMYLNNLNDRLGMDLKESGFTVSLAQDCYEKGLLNNDQTDGLDLRFGNADAVEKLLGKIARREGRIGNILAEGAKLGAESIGGDAPKFAVHFGKGQAPHTHDPRGRWSILFTQMISDTGSLLGGGVDADPNETAEEAAAKEFDPRAVAEVTAAGAGYGQFKDTLGCCMFLLGANPNIVAETLSAATGWSLTAQDCEEVGRRIVNTQRAFNIIHGKTAADDSASYRMSEAPPDGPAKGISIAPQIVNMRRIYYKNMGWDEETSKPLPETLRKLGLDDVIEDLWD